MMNKCFILLICALFLSGCARTEAILLTPTGVSPTSISYDTPVPTFSTEPLPSYTSMPTQDLVPISSSTPEPLILPAPVVFDQPGPLYTTVIQIPVGESGVQYRGAGIEEMQPVGPNGLVVTPDGVVIVGDIVGNRLLRYELNGTRLEDIDLEALGILNISDLVSTGDNLYILEISFNTLPERYRLNQLTSAGRLVRQYDLPKGFHFEDGLFGLALGYSAEGMEQVLIQLDNADNSQYYQLPDSAEGLPEKLPARPVFGTDLAMQSAGPEELAVLSLGNQEFESQMTTGGALFLLSARADGSLYLEREDLIAWDPIVTTDITIHYVKPDGTQAGMARYPIGEWYFYVFRFLTVGPDGNVYGLITREASVDILRLNFYSELEPLNAAAVIPSITPVAKTEEAEPAYDCSSLSHYLPDSAEAQQIVQSFITNFQQDWPTEYMAFEQLWSVDQLDKYAVIQGLVTPEESDVIITQETDRGYELLFRYTSNMLLPGFRHNDIRGYLAAQSPGLPAELIQCLDLVRFIGQDE